MLARITPTDIMTPFNNAYSHGVVIPPNASVLFVSGQIGALPNGDVPTDGSEQARNVWRNVMAVVQAAGMGVEHIVKLTAYIVDPAVYPAYAAARNAALGDREPPASTAIIVPQLISPDWKIEVEAIAALPAS